MSAAPSDIRVEVLGPVQVTVAGEELRLAPVLTTCLAALLVDRPHVVPVDTVLARVWEDGSLATLHSNISRLRSRLGSEVVVTRPPGYRLDLPEAATDVEQLVGLVAAARAESDPAVGRELLREALGLWRGPAYADVDRPFARTAAVSLQERRLEAHTLAAELDLRLGRHRQVVEELSPLLADEPWHEGLRGQLMVALYRCGQQAAALETYEAGRRMLVEELGVDPGPGLRQLHAQLLRQDPALDPPEPGESPGTPPPHPAAPSASRVPPLVDPGSPLLGRDRELSELVDHLKSGQARLTTLTGIGGVGKTRLALAAAHRVSDHYADGAVVVPLATVPAPSLVLATVATSVTAAFGAAQGAGVDALSDVVSLLQDREVLLVLDNLEHLLDAASEVAALVAACPRLTVLATSRAPLRVSAEEEWLVEPLLVPERSASVTELGELPAVRLFTARARAVSRGFRLDERTVAVVAETCRRLGGIPLAIELAASRARVLSPQSLLDRLDDALPPGSRDLPDRQRTMRDTLDWSCRLLDPDAERVFCALGVFVGGFTLEHLHEVIGGDVVEPLQRLVEHSLVGVSWSEHGEPRYTVLEPVRQHARSRADPAQLARDERAHVAAYLMYAERAARGYQHADQVRWLALVDDEHPNLQAAFDRSVASGDHDTACRLVWALWLYWWFRGLSAIGRRAAVQAAALPDASRPQHLRAVIISAAMAFAQGDYDAAGEGWEHARDLAAEDGDAEAQGQGEAGMGINAITRGDLATAIDHHRAAIALGATLPEDTDGPWIVTMNELWLGTALLGTGERAEALECLARGRRLADERGDRLGAFLSLWFSAQAETGADEHAARAYLIEGIRLSGEVVDLANLSYFLDALVIAELRIESAASVTGSGLHRKAQLLGVAQRCREQGNGRAYGFYRPDDASREEARAQIAAALGEDEFGREVERGRRLDVDRAVALAVGEGAPVASGLAANGKGAVSRD